MLVLELISRDVRLCRSFNQDIGDWDVASGTDFSWMFHAADAFNQGYKQLGCK